MFSCMSGVPPRADLSSTGPGLRGPGTLLCSALHQAARPETSTPAVVVGCPRVCKPIEGRCWRHSGQDGSPRGGLPSNCGQRTRVSCPHNASQLGSRPSGAALGALMGPLSHVSFLVGTPTPPALTAVSGEGGAGTVAVTEAVLAAGPGSPLRRGNAGRREREPLQGLGGGAPEPSADPSPSGLAQLPEVGGGYQACAALCALPSCASSPSFCRDLAAFQPQGPPGAQPTPARTSVDARLGTVLFFLPRVNLNINRRVGGLVSGTVTEPS